MIIAIDPGVHGGIAVGAGPNTVVHAMPATRGDAITLMQDLYLDAPASVRGKDDVVVFIEKINGYIPMAGAAQMFQFGKLVERMGCIAEQMGLRVIEVPPKTWQKALGLGSKSSVGQEKKGQQTRWKNKLKAEAQRRFPNVKVTLDTADALLILEYARTQTNPERFPAPWNQ
jgi:hypothetical protein